jgi:ABC-type uncharacterized transport system substrate-binding protein
MRDGETGQRDPARLLILNSYTLTGRRPEEQVRVRAFLQGLEEEGFRAGGDLQLTILDFNDLTKLERQLDAALALETPHVIHAVGTPNAILAVRRGGGIPVIYYGAHPEGAGEIELAHDHVRGVRLTLPFTSSYKSYRFLRRLMPKVQRVWVPFYEGTVFCSEAMKERHRAYRHAYAGSPWIAGESEWIGYKSLAGLHHIIGLEYRELVYRDLDDLEAAFDHIERERALLMPYNDSVYCAGAPHLLTGFAAAAELPLIWNNNPEATRIGALAAISGCFREAGRICARQAARVLRTGTTEGIETVTSSRSFASIDLERAAALGLAFSDGVLEYFDEIFPTTGPAASAAVSARPSEGIP